MHGKMPTIINITPPATPAAQTGRVVIDEARNAFEWVLAPAARTASPTLTEQDRKELMAGSTPIRNMEKAAKAKVIYAAGGGAKDMHNALGYSLSYSEKLHAAFERAMSYQFQKSV